MTLNGDIIDLKDLKVGDKIIVAKNAPTISFAVYKIKELKRKSFTDTLVVLETNKQKEFKKRLFFKSKYVLEDNKNEYVFYNSIETYYNELKDKVNLKLKRKLEMRLKDLRKD